MVAGVVRFAMALVMIICGSSAGAERPKDGSATVAKTIAILLSIKRSPRRCIVADSVVRDSQHAICAIAGSASAVAAPTIDAAALASHKAAAETASNAPARRENAAACTAGSSARAPTVAAAAGIACSAASATTASGFCNDCPAARKRRRATTTAATARAAGCAGLATPEAAVSGSGRTPSSASTNCDRERRVGNHCDCCPDVCSVASACTVSSVVGVVWDSADEATAAAGSPGFHLHSSHAGGHGPGLIKTCKGEDHTVCPSNQSL